MGVPMPPSFAAANHIHRERVDVGVLGCYGDAECDVTVVV
jgi:hypothetical protein